MTRRVSRRTFIAGAAGAGVLATGGATSWAALASRDSNGEPATPDLEPTPTFTSTAEPTTNSPAAPPPPGGRQVIVSPTGFSVDTFDAQLTGESSVVEILGRTHSRLVQWIDTELPVISPDLATSWEMPDATTTVFRIDPKAKWHDKPPLNGRPVTASDIVVHFQRSLEIAAGGKAPLAQRYHTYSTIESIDSPGDGLVRIRTKQPDPFLLDTLASEFALIQAPEAVRDFADSWSKAESDHVIGSGPWTFAWADDGVKFEAVRNGHREPLLDELFVTEPHDVAQRFIDGQLDETITRDRRDAERVRAKIQVVDALPSDRQAIRDATAGGRVSAGRRFERQILFSSFAVGAPPWNDPALIGTLSGVLNRHELAKRLFGGRARPAQPVPMAGTAGRISAERLKFVPGYRFLEGEYKPDPEYLRQWQAAGGPGLGPITIDFPSIFDPLYSASSIVVGMLNEALGPQFRPAVETYTTISKRVREGYYGDGRAAFWFGWGPAFSSPMGERYLSEMYDRGSPGQRVTGGAGTPGTTQDAILNITESGYFGIVPWVHQFAEVYRRPAHTGPAPSPFWNQHLDYLRTSA